MLWPEGKYVFVSSAEEGLFLFSYYYENFGITHLSYEDHDEPIESIIRRYPYFEFDEDSRDISGWRDKSDRPHLTFDEWLEFVGLAPSEEFEPAASIDISNFLYGEG